MSTEAAKVVAENPTTEEVPKVDQTKDSNKQEEKPAAAKLDETAPHSECAGSDKKVDPEQS